jgi:acyl carrier protein
MEKDEVLNILRRIIAKQLNSDDSPSRELIKEEEIRPDNSFRKDLGADSLDVIEILTAVEETFGLSIPDEVLEKIETVGQAVDSIVTAMAKLEPSEKWDKKRRM